MAWEHRGGRTYLYLSRRVRGQPRKIYVGAGPEAEAVAAQEANRIAERRAARQALRAEQERTAPAEQALRELDAIVDLLARAVLLINGFHEHRGCWRLRK